MRKAILFLIIGAAVLVAFLVAAGPFFYNLGKETANRARTAIAKMEAETSPYADKKRTDGLVTLKPPYDDVKWNSNNPNDRISVQNAAQAVSIQAGLKYNYKRSLENTDPICRTWTYPDFENKQWKEALEEILSPHGLTYVLVHDELVLIKTVDLPKWEEDQRRLSEHLAYLTSSDFKPEPLLDAVLIFPLLDRDGKTTGPGTMLAELGMLKATYAPRKIFNLHVPSVIDRYQSSGYMFPGKTVSPEEREDIKAEFRAKNFATGRLELSDDNAFQVVLNFEGERGKKEFSAEGTRDEMNSLPYWIAQCIYTYCEVAVTSEIEDWLEVPELRHPDALSTLVGLESEYQKGGGHSSSWNNLLQHNPDSSFILYRYQYLERGKLLDRINSALRVWGNHDFFLFLEAESYQIEKKYEDSAYRYLALLKTDVQNDILYSRLDDGLLGLSRNEDAIALYRFWKTHNPDSYLAYYKEGAFYVDYAWDARGSGFANTVTEENWKIFRERLSIAEKSLTRAYELNPDDPAVPVEMMRVAIGLRYSREEMEKWFENAVQAEPTYYRAYRTKLHYLKPIWYGSNEEMLEFARDCAAHPPTESRVAFILVDAHDFLSYRSEGNGQKREDYFTKPEVWKEVKAVYEEHLSMYPDSMWDRNYFAKYACYAKDYEEAKQQFEYIGNDMELQAWNSEKEFKRYKAIAYSNGKGPSEEDLSGDSWDRQPRHRSNDNRMVSLKPPFTGWNPNKRDPEDQIAVIDAVDAICRQAGMPHDFEKSYENIKPLCNQRISPAIEKRPWKEAMESMLDPLDLTYTSENGKVVLTRN